MAWINIDEYLDRRYSERSRPPKKTVWHWLRTGKTIPRAFVKKEGRHYYIDERALNLTGNALVDKVLCQ